MNDTAFPWETCPDVPWNDRVFYARQAGGYARRRDWAVCTTEEAWQRARYHILRLSPDAEIAEQAEPVGCDDHPVYPISFDEASSGFSVEELIDILAEENHYAEPNYVLFANPVYANPVYSNPVYSNPVYSNPVYSNPVYSNPVYSNPVYSNPVYSNPVYSNPVSASPVYSNPVYSNPVYAEQYIRSGERPSTARPSSPPDRPRTRYKAGRRGRTVIILDTGIAALRTKHHDNFCPKMLRTLAEENPEAWEVPTCDPHDGEIDPVSGHGTFIAGIVQTLAPGTRILPRKVVTSYGDIDILTVAHDVGQLCRNDELDGNTIINMSFGGYADEKMVTLQRAVRCIRQHRAVVVASAGNDATSRPLFPACLPGVIGVAALDGYGPAPYSNRGAWVSACAPGSDLVSAFFQNFNGSIQPIPGGTDPDDFRSWARWTGTSFAAPVVTSTLMREMRITGCDARTAVRRTVEAPGLFRLPGLGTVVNLDMGDLIDI
jgi:hypothetical protein